MDKIVIRDLGHKILDLIELCAEFEARGSRTPTVNNSEEQWKLYESYSNQIFQMQKEIAAQLEDDAIFLRRKDGSEIDIKPNREFQGNMTAGAAKDILGIIANMLITVKKSEATPSYNSEDMLKNYQHRIARMLDPKAVRSRHGDDII